MKKQYLFIVSAVVFLGLVFAVSQYYQALKTEDVSAVTVGTPNPGHSLAQLECSADSLCVDTANKRVGIGTANPTQKLDVSSGNIQLGDSRSTSSLLIGFFGHKIGREPSDGSLYIGGGQANIILHVGIGTTNPKSKLDINGNHVFGSKYVNLSTTSTPILSVTFPNCHSGAYIKVYIGGVDWADHSGGGHYTEAFLIDGCGSYGEPGTIVVDRNSQIGSIATSLSISNHVITLSAALNSYSVNQLITYEVQGVFTAVN